VPATQPNDREHGQKDAEQRLVESALTLFSENGYDGTSIRAIIERARVTRPVLYYYFKNKEDLFFRLAHSSFAEFNSFLDEMTARVSGCRERLKTLLRWVFEQTERSPEMVRLILHAFFSGSEENLRPRMRAMAEGRFARIVGIMRDGLE
jgi:AcrR family transcriptional regulator